MIWRDLISILSPIITKIVLLLSLAYLLERILIKIGKWWYQFVSFPGVVIHELGHFGACLLTFTKIQSFNLFASREDGTLGQVSHEKRNFVIDAFIGMMPFFLGGAVIFLLSGHVFGIHAFRSHRIAPGDIPDIATWTEYFSFAKNLAISYYREADSILGRLDYRLIKSYAYLYVMISIGMHLKPSAADRKSFLALFFLMLFSAYGVYKGLEFFHIAQDYDIRLLLAHAIKGLNYIFDKGIGFTLLGLGINLVIFCIMLALGKIVPKGKS